MREPVRAATALPFASLQVKGDSYAGEDRGPSPGPLHRFLVRGPRMGESTVALAPCAPKSKSNLNKLPACPTRRAAPKSSFALSRAFAFGACALTRDPVLQLTRGPCAARRSTLSLAWLNTLSLHLSASTLSLSCFLIALGSCKRHGAKKGGMRSGRVRDRKSRRRQKTFHTAPRFQAVAAAKQRGCCVGHTHPRECH
jgi:hypothetical protein